MRKQIDKKYNSASFARKFQTNRPEEIRINKVLRFIGKNKKVLDLGCGDGYIMEKIKTGKNTVIGIDVVDYTINLARKKGFKVYNLSLNAENWNEKILEKFDTVFAGEIIEHIFDTDIFLQNIYKILKPKGQLVLTTPNLASLGRRLLLLIGNNPLIETTSRSYDANHIRYFTFESLKKLLSENKFEILKEESSVINFNLSGKLYSTFLAKVFPRFGNNIILNCRKK